VLMALVVFPLMRTGANAGNRGMACPMAVLFFGSAICGAVVPRALWRWWVPSQCPSCGGRAYCSANDRLCYRCRDCGREHEVRA